MAIKGLNVVTLTDVAKDKNYGEGDVAEVLVQYNSMNNDIPYVEMNMGTYHIEPIRSALPDVWYVKANQAIPPTKTGIEERNFVAAHFGSKSEIAKMVAERGGMDRVSFRRWSEAKAHIQSHAIEQAELMIYGSPVDNNQKVGGFMDVYSTLDPNEETSKQIIDGGGTGSALHSILLIAWGMESIFGVYPTGSQAGLKREDHGLQQILRPLINNPSQMGHTMGYVEEFSVDHGLVVKDFRQGARIANIDPATLKSGVGAADLIDLMIDAMYKLDSLENGQPVFYMNRTLMAHLDKQSRKEVGAAGGLTYSDYQGKPVLTFRGIPIRRADAMNRFEEQVIDPS